ncbi:hypothetical protein EIP86_000290 [Pleurotus ostreatoroseus]|nr:hypothetical protein EIP86_000290 [Pleurotus ostreatoroseus]
MFPKEWTDHGLIEKGPNDAEVHRIWAGEGVYQMTILESDNGGDGLPQGVVLALVGPAGDSPKDQEGIPKWAAVQPLGSAPLQMNDLPSGKSSAGRHQNKSKTNITKGLKNLRIDPSSSQSRDSRSSLILSGAPPGRYPEMNRRVSPDTPASIDSTWDLVEDLPIRWATDYVSLAAQGTRLYNTPVLFYDMWRDPNERNRGLAYLAVIVKNNILLYQAPKGERAFRFMKEFYTPLTARSVSFVQQSVQDMTRSPSDVTPRTRNHPSHILRHAKGLSMGNASQYYPAQLSLFVIFEKKAGMIRILDSAVAEIEMYDDNSTSVTSLLSPSGSSPSLGRRNRASWDGRGFVKETKAPWIPPHKINLPSTTGRTSFAQSMYILTRGKHSQVLPYPLPANLAAIPPYRTLGWSFTPTYVSTRVCRPSGGMPSFLQFIAFGEEGVEIQEISLSSLSEVKGKGKAEEPIRILNDVGGLDSGFLVTGGHWDKAFWLDLGYSPVSGYDSNETEEDLSSEEIADSYQAQEGVYGWTRKGTEDWRIFWLGGCGANDQGNA